jgi:hypothetical protein
METKKQEVCLIDGIFSTEDAKELLLNLLDKKIQFHQMKNFSSKERFGVDDKIATHRIPMLVESKTELERFIAIAKSENKKLKVNSIISLELE